MKANLMIWIFLITSGISIAEDPTEFFAEYTINGETTVFLQFGEPGQEKIEAKMGHWRCKGIGPNKDKSVQLECFSGLSDKRSVLIPLQCKDRNQKGIGFGLTDTESLNGPLTYYVTIKCYGYCGGKKCKN